jgi:diguanylate cyclase
MLSSMRRHCATSSWSTALAIALLFAASAVLRASASGPDNLILTPGAGAVPLEGKWQFHLGDNRAWAAPAFDDSTWEQLTADRPWGQQGHAGYHGFAWYRRHLVLAPTAGGTPPFALLVPEVGQAYEVYWNGVLIGRRGSLPPHPVWFHDPGPQVILLPNSTEGVLALRMWNAPLLRA